MSWSEIALIIVSIINALGVLVSPIITACINSRNALKLEKVKKFDKERIRVLNSFIKTSHDYFAFCTCADQQMTKSLHQDMIESFLNLQLYFELEESTRNKLFEMERKGGYEEDWNFRNNLIVTLSNQINKSIN